MISDQLAELADTILYGAIRGQPMSSEIVAHVAKILIDLSRQVKAMEDQPVPVPLRAPLPQPRRPV